MTRRLLFLLAAAGALMAADLANVRTVYVMPMSHGMDQYIANRLTNDHVFTIVTDAKMADAVITDHVGSSLQTKLDDMMRPPVVEKTKDEKDKAKDKDKDAPQVNSLAESISKTGGAMETSSISRSRGTVFLVDTKSRQVVWSAYDLPKDSSSKELDRTASDIVSRIKKDLNPSAKK